MLENEKWLIDTALRNGTSFNISEYSRIKGVIHTRSFKTKDDNCIPPYLNGTVYFSCNCIPVLNCRPKLKQDFILLDCACAKVTLAECIWFVRFLVLVVYIFSIVSNQSV